MDLRLNYYSLHISKRYEARFEDDQQGKRAALSESMPNILYVQDRGNPSADGRSLMDKDDISTGNDEREKNWEMNLSEEVETGLINMSPSFPRSIASVEQEIMPERELEEIDNTKSEKQENLTPNECPNCEVMQSKLSAVDAKTDDKQQENSSITDIHDSTEEIKKWKAHCTELKSKLQAVQTDMMQQMSAYQLKIDEAINGRQITLAKLAKAQEKVISLEAALKQQKETNIALSNAIQDMELKSVERLEKQKSELIRSAEMSLARKDQLYRATQNKVVTLEAMLKTAHNDNKKLLRNLELAADNLKNMQFGEMTREEFDRRMEKKLNSIMEKFKDEAKSSDLAWMGEENVRYVLDGFETVIKTILGKEPHLVDLAEQLVIFMEAKFRAGTKSVEPSNADEENNSEEKAFKDFKAEVIAEIESTLENFHARYSEEISEGVAKIMSCMSCTEQKLESSVIQRIDSLGDLLLVVDNKQNDIQATEERMKSRLDNLSEAMEGIGNRVSYEGEEYAAEMTNLWRDRYNIKAALHYVEQIGGDQIRLENRMRNIEEQYAMLEQGMRNGSERPLDYIRNNVSYQPVNMQYGIPFQPVSMQYGIAPQSLDTRYDLTPPPAEMRYDMLRQPVDKRRDMSPQPVDMYHDMPVQSVNCSHTVPSGRHCGQLALKQDNKNKGQRKKTAYHGEVKEILKDESGTGTGATEQGTMSPKKLPELKFPKFYPY
uniref:Bm7929 n=1 Tax=Brugia malayi TaxID=6279 RepID=A0A0I9N415_BRUMA|nr:Bm7929 [Brugia malayi]